MCEIRLLFPVHMRTFFQDDTWQSGLEEIRVRVGQPIEFCYGSDNCYLTGKEKEQMFCSEKDYRRWEKDAGNVELYQQLFAVRLQRGD